MMMPIRINRKGRNTPGDAERHSCLQNCKDFRGSCLRSRDLPAAGVTLQKAGETAFPQGARFFELRALRDLVTLKPLGLGGFGLPPKQLVQLFHQATEGHDLPDMIEIRALI